MRRYDQTWTPGRVAADLKWVARDAIYDGTEATRDVLQRCRGFYAPTGSLLCYTRDIGHYTSGWFKNPDYEACSHLSLSFRDPDTHEPRPFDRALGKQWAELFFETACRLLWVEPPFSRAGKILDVYHYRLFVEPRTWTPILPRKEVYSRDFTPPGYRTWSEIHGEGFISIERRSQ